MNLHGVPSRDANSGQTYSKPTHYTVPTELLRIIAELRHTRKNLR